MMPQTSNISNYEFFWINKSNFEIKIAKGYTIRLQRYRDHKI